jgi:hypothetical protein
LRLGPAVFGCRQLFKGISQLLIRVTERRQRSHRKCLRGNAANQEPHHSIGIGNALQVINVEHRLELLGQEFGVIGTHPERNN